MTAFICSPLLLSRSRWTQANVVTGPRKFTASTTGARRCRLKAADRLYPEPSEPESIDNPINPPTPSASSGDYLSRLSESPDDVGKAAPSITQNAVLSPNAVLKAYAPASRALWRLGWASWWVQLTLTIIAATIVLFAFAFPGVNVRSSASLAGFVLAGAGIIVSFLSLGCTYSYTRLSIWLTKPGPKLTKEAANSRITNSLRIGLLLAITGLVVSLTGLQAIVGTLLARLLSAGIASTPYRTYADGAQVVSGPSFVQPVDVLVVQASANAMTALISALIITVWMRARAKKWGESA